MEELESRPPRTVIDALYKQDFFAFVQEFLKVADPTIDPVFAPYIEALCYKLELVALGDLLRLLINIPPRHLKSQVTSVLFVAWLLMNNPTMKIAVVSHDERLVSLFASNCKQVLNSDSYRRLSPGAHIREGRDKARDFETVAGGRVLFASIESGLTGHGFDVIIVDDPQPSTDIGSEVERKRVHNLFESGVSTRLNNPVRGAIVVLQQRLHDDDLSGHLLTRGNWDHFCLPLVATESAEYQTKYGFWHRSEGEVLIPELYPESAIERLHAEKGGPVYFTQYQQTPTAGVGGEIEPHHLKYIPALPNSVNTFYVSVDTASTCRSSSNYTVFMLLGTDGENYYIVKVLRERIDIDEMFAHALRLGKQYNIQKFIIEDSTLGPSLEKKLRLAGIRAILEPVGSKDKLQRLRDHRDLFIDGKIVLVGEAPWVSIFRQEAETFPFSKYNDQVDALTTFLGHIRREVPFKPYLARSHSAYDDGASPTYQKPRGGGHPMRPRFKRRF